MRGLHRLLMVGFVALLLAVVPSAFAQKITGTITGTVTDVSGAVIADASVTVTSTKTGASRTTNTNSDGSYSFPDLEAGVYTVSATKTGFKKVTEKDVELHVSDITTVTVKLPVGGVSESVVVEASAVQVETQSGTVGNVVNGQEVRELPLNARNFVQLTTLMPGAAVAENFDPKNKGLLAAVDISFSGAPANANQWRVDGANNNDIGSQRTILVFPSIDAIEEFKILRNSYGPEFGGAGGSQVNIITRGGGNDFHGTAFYFGRNDALIAKNTLLGPSDHKQLLRRNDYGYNIGGPVKKDKIFFFWSEEWNKEKRARVRSQQIPTLAERGNPATNTPGDYTDMVAGCPGQIPTDPFNGNAPFTFNGVPNMIDPARISPAGWAYLSQLPAPNRSNPCTQNWVQGVTIPVNWREENVRGDVHLTKSTVLTLRYTQDSWDNPLHSDAEGGLWGEQAYPSISDAWDQPGKVAIAKLTTTIGSSATNDFTFSWSANRINLALAGDNPGLNATIKAAFPTVFPQSGKLHGAGTAEPLCWCGGESGFLGHFGPWNNGQDLFTWKDDFSKVVGRHVLKTGVYYSKNKKDEETGSDNGGLWGASGHGSSQWNGTTGNEYGNYLVRGINWGYGENARNGKAQARWSDLEFYFGDSWKARPRLTLEYGVRWSFTPPVYDAANNYSSFRPDLYVPALGGAACNGILLPSGAKNTCPPGSGGTIGPNRSLAPSNYHLIAPRLGFAWDVFGTGRFALRGGVGQFFSRDPVGILVRVESNNAPEAIAPGGERQLDGPLTPGVSLFDFGLGGGPKQSIENNNHIANSWQWNLTTETELWKNSKLEVGWVALRGIHLNSSEFLNEIKPADRLTYINDGQAGNTAAQNALFPFSALPGNPNLAQWNHRGDSIYHSLQAMFQTRISHNSQFQSSYTWSKNIGDTTLAYVDTNTGIVDRYNPRAGRGPVDFDRRQIFNASFIYNLPALEHQNGFVKGVVGGWEASSIVNVFNGPALRILESGLNAVCDLDVVTNTSGTSNDCDQTHQNPLDPTSPVKGRFGFFGGNPWGIGSAARYASAPNRVFSQPCHISSGDRTAWLNPKAFTYDGFHLGGYPNAGPGVCTGPGVADVDFAIDKNWNLPFHNKVFSEKSKIQFRMEFFNLFNHPMFRFAGNNLGFNTNGGIVQNGVYSCASNGLPGAKDCSLAGSNFGVANVPSNIGNREIQYGLKILF
jgi:Carboxypeptidase regulatory-like domain